MPSIDISIAFDNAEYLTPQIYLQLASLKDKIPEDTTLHVTTTRCGDDILKYISKNFNTKIYKKPQLNCLKSRCRYLLRTIEIESDADYVLKADLDILFLNDFKELQDMAKTGADIIIQSENRRIIQDERIETRVWKALYKSMGYELPDIRLPYVEGHELGRPLLNSGAFLIRNDRMNELQGKWIELTQKAEEFMQYNIHPNESSLSAIILCENWKWLGLHQWLHFNPIAHFRYGDFPSQKLRENCIIPEPVFMLHWHKPQWLYHLSRYNQNVKDVINRVSERIPVDWWDLPLETYLEK